MHKVKPQHYTRHDSQYYPGQRVYTRVQGYWGCKGWTTKRTTKNLVRFAVPFILLDTESDTETGCTHQGFWLLPFLSRENSEKSKTKNSEWNHMLGMFIHPPNWNLALTYNLRRIGIHREPHRKKISIEKISFNFYTHFAISTRLWLKFPTSELWGNQAKRAMKKVAHLFSECTSSS